MKKVLTIAALFIAALASAQQMPQLPTDPSIKIGKLDNGMTYYIRANDKPEQRAEFYLVTHVGAVQEAPDQDGLAHFLEHMCFNGTKNFPGKSLLNYLESIGASFGGNINASTGLEMTQYMLNNIPIVREGVVDTCLLIMHDYSHFVTCAPEEIDAERGVIIEEKRSRNNAGWRSFMKEKEYLYKGSVLAHTSLIGSQEQLETFKYESLTNFYHTWYRPDLQALVVVGDIDPEAIEAKIKTIFADIPAVENPQPKQPLTVEDNEEPIIGIVTDPETASTSFELVWKSEPMPTELNNTAIGLVTDIIKSLAASAMNERLSDIAATSDAPFLSASFGFHQLCEATDNIVAFAGTDNGKQAAIKGLCALYTEIERMSRYGFTQDEIERAKADLINSFENAANKADTRKNPEFIRPIIANFKDNMPLMDPKDRLELINQIMPRIDVKTVNQVAQQVITKDNLVVIYEGPEKEGIEQPVEADILDAINAVRASEIAAPQQGSVATSLLNAKKIKGGKIKSEIAGPFESTVITLSNGVKVVLRPSDLEKNKVSIDIRKQGGRSLVSTEDIGSIDENIWSLYVSNTGVAGFSANDVVKILAGKTVKAYPYINETEHGIAAATNAKDIETTMQLMYLYYVQPRFDQTEYDQGINQIKAILPNIIETSDFKLGIEVMNTMYGNNPRRKQIDQETLESASLGTLEKIYKELFKDAAGAVVYITGDFDIAAVKPLAAKYFGALPKGKTASMWVDANDSPVDGKHIDHFTARMETPAVTVYQLYKSNAPYSMENSITTQGLAYILNMTYVNTLREEEGGTYGASVNTVRNRVPVPYTMLQVAFQTNEQQAERLIELAIEGLRNIAENGPSEADFDKTIKLFSKQIPESRITNAYWEACLENWIDYGEDTDAAREAAINALTPEKIQKLAAEMIDGGNYIEIVMSPEK